MAGCDKHIHESNKKRTYNSYDFYGIRFNLLSNYLPLKPIGCGAFGAVISGVEVTTGKKVAIKKVKNAFEDLNDTKRLIREVMLMKFFRNDDQILSIQDFFIAPDSNSHSAYIVTELMDTDLKSIIDSPQTLTIEHAKCFIYQILRGIRKLHASGVIHRDLKPANILVNADCTCKICDFGLARMYDTLENHLTEYVTTRWYRAPEIILSWKKYTKSIDVWSVGCIFAEILLRKPLFCGTSYLDQIHKIFDMLGTPDESEIRNIQSPVAQRYVQQLPFRKKKPFSSFFPKNTDPLALDLLEKMLRFDPEKRCTVEEALNHEFLQDWREEDDPISTSPTPIHFDFDIENFQFNQEILESLFHQESFQSTIQAY